ncbi:elicitor-responsive protein 1-like isoform X1 [Triticum dicoccoides]|uniref:elicitor-responsive protein 1-like isoform X1 n=1 Tax=Triticum dicoccoides TaxID=85692 RepID=UPI00188EFD31|nr:elicitor-responsive protein 1-like isoform X1 [Triticum dicoccoides]XP_037440119.1 elicitor-responsive protein 1-like isoform X1 [Triticum dicoccoides]XP_037440120.1 elicitor-responsive protein 1-like isoform X1 [Triticum dicoccoides]XP_037440121.1 elicitor-responsive protein 1-like isoform X1 [Triticum dicoccoides]XP_037440122.1 elicitor-responsive protein 1-like isoform X1 [Triticum dicoccoides]XP_037440123.1 elicitor-responsive protein 1-like isoform X1 [Triticum dicoccoides]XP_03744012
MMKGAARLWRLVLEVHLVDSKGLFGSDFLGKIDPYVIVQYRSQERKSSTSRGWCLRSTSRDEGRNPSWNEVFRFQINSSAANGQHKLFLRIMDHDNFSSDDFLGQATINVSDLITLGMESGSSQQNPATGHRPEAGVVVELGGVVLRLRRHLLPIPRPWRCSSQDRGVSEQWLPPDPRGGHCGPLRDKAAGSLLPDWSGFR